MENKKEEITQPKVAIITPSRGLIFSEVVQYVEDVRSTYPNIIWFTSHNLPIPDCFNHLVDKALENKSIEYFWFIEEDTIPPEKTLDNFFIAMNEFDIAACDYGFNNNSNTIARSSITGEILFCGFGCTFMKRKVLEAFKKPIFRADRAFNLSNMQWYPTDPLRVYGMYDVVFGSDAHKKGFKFYQVGGECRHLQLIELGNKETNNGCHIINEKGRIDPAKRVVLPIKEI